MAFPRNFMDELLARNDIVDVVGSYVPLISKSGSYWGCCPFHNEKTPSFHVLRDKQIYHCFGCKKGGGVINFVMEMENFNYPDAVRFLAKRTGMEVPEEDGDREAGRRRQRLLDLNRDAARFYYQLLQQPEGRAVQEYLNRRQITKATAVKFGFGASPDSWDTLLNAMTRKGYTKQELLDAGLVVQNRNGGLYDKFRNRLMLPVIDTRGDVVAFGSRVLDKSEPKYMNSSETPVYSKRRVLYGLNLAKKSKRSNIILCEGNLDIVTLHQAGFDNAVASMGTALTPEQTRLLSRYTKELVLCYDNDNAGKLATERALQILNNSEFSVKVLELPRRRTETGDLVKQDPDDFIKFHGADAFERLLNGSENGVEFRMAQIANKYDLNSDEARVAYCAEVSVLLADLTNETEREVYASRAAKIASVPVDSLKYEVSKTINKRLKIAGKKELRKILNPAREVQFKDKNIHVDSTRSAVSELGIIRLLIMDASLFNNDFPLDSSMFSNPLYGKIFSLLWDEHIAGTQPEITSLTEKITQDEMSYIISALQSDNKSFSTNRKKMLEDYICVIRNEAERRIPKAENDIDLLAIAAKNKHKKGTGGKQNG